MSANRDQWRAACAPLGVLLVLSVGLLCVSAPASAARGAGTAGGAGVVAVSSQAQPQRLAVRPHGYYRHTAVLGLQWSSWGQAVALGKGTFTFQFCVDESCSVSPVFVDPVAVLLSAIKRCRGRPSYTKLELRVEGTLPDASFESFHTKLGACRR